MDKIKVPQSNFDKMGKMVGIGGIFFNRLFVDILYKK